MIVERAKNIILKPKETWQEILAEEATIQSLFLKYAVYLALIPSAALIIGYGLVGLRIGPAFYRMPIGTALMSALVSYIFNLAGVFANGYIINFVGHYFASESNINNAMKLSVYSATAFWLAGIFTIVPSLGVLSILGLYSIYLMYLGIPILMKTPAEKVMPYTITIIVISIILAVILNSLISSFVYGPIYSELLTY